jgi:hypothetical protein
MTHLLVGLITLTTFGEEFNLLRSSLHFLSSLLYLSPLSAPSIRSSLGQIHAKDQVTYGYIWLRMVMYGYVWLHMVTCGYVWLHMVTYGYIWLHMVTYGYIWLHVVTYGYLWLRMVTYGYVWLHMVTEERLSTRER